MMDKNHRKLDNGDNNNTTSVNSQLALPAQWGRTRTIQKYPLTFLSFIWLWNFCRNTWSMFILRQGLWWPYLLFSLEPQVIYKRFSQLPAGTHRAFLQVSNLNLCRFLFHRLVLRLSHIIVGQSAGFVPRCPSSLALGSVFHAHLMPVSGSEMPHPSVNQNFIFSSILKEEWTIRDTCSHSCPFSSQSDLIRP